MLRLSASPLLGHVPSVSLAVNARWEFAGLAGLATLAALALASCGRIIRAQAAP